MSEGIRAQYAVLSDLKKVDEKIVRLQGEASRIPQELAKLEAALGARRAEYTKAKDTFEATEKNLRKSEQELREREDKLHKAEGKMMEVKTNEEYQAAMRENQGQKDEKGKVEEQLIGMMGQVEEQRKTLKELETTFKSYEATITEDKTRLEEERLKLVNLIEEQLQQRHEFSAKLSPTVADLYGKVVSRSKGVAIVNIENGMCLGCNIKVPPQLYNEVLGFKVVHKCPSCGRLLTLKSFDNEESA